MCDLRCRWRPWWRGYKLCSCCNECNPCDTSQPYTNHQFSRQNCRCTGCTLYRQGTVSRLCDLRVLFVPVSRSIASAGLRLSVVRLYNNYRINTTQIRDWPRKPCTFWPVQSPGSRSILYQHVRHLVPVPRHAGWSVMLVQAQYCKLSGKQIVRDVRLWSTDTQLAYLLCVGRCYLLSLHSLWLMYL